MVVKIIIKRKVPKEKHVEIVSGLLDQVGMLSFIEKDEIYIAVAAPMSGPEKATGEAQVKGINLYISKFTVIKNNFCSSSLIHNSYGNLIFHRFVHCVAVYNITKHFKGCIYWCTRKTNKSCVWK